jgi:AcrR family transcriptional regulator
VSVARARRGRERPGTGSSERQARRAGEILDAASALLAERGYDGLQMREIARGAGVSAGTLYSYFDTKEHIFATLATREFARLSARIEEAARDSEVGFEELLVRLMPEFVGFHRHFGKHFSSWVRSKQGGDAGRTRRFMEPFGQRYHGMMAQFEETLRKLAQREGRTLDASPLCMRLIWSTIVGLADEYVHKRNVSHGYSPDDLTRYAVRALRAALLR